MSHSMGMSRRAALAAPLLLLGRHAAAQDAAVFTVSRVVGAVSVQEAGGAPMAAVPGLAMREGARIATAAGSRIEIAAADGTTLTIGDRTTLVLTAVMLPQRGRRGRGLIDLIEGILRIHLPGSWNRFEVTTSTAVASVRSTTLLVEAGADNTAVFVSDGRVQVATARRTRGVLLNPGFGTDVRAGAAPLAPRRWGQARIDAAMARLS